MDFDLSKMNDEEKLYYHMHHALEKAKRTKKKSIFLAGQIRSGKSTTFNWIKHPQSLIGDKSEAKIFYSLQNKQDKTLAEIANQFQSLTLVQNMISIQEKGEEVSLIDLPGFNENRTEIQILLCSFIMKSCFTHSNQVKFILVISDNGFKLNDGSQFTAMLKNFVKLFKFKEISAEQKEKLFSSVSMVITAVNFTDEKQAINSYLKMLTENLRLLKKKSKTNSQVQEIIDFTDEMVTNIIKNKRLQLFKEATVGKTPQKSTIIEHFNHFQWNYFDISAIRDNYLSFPFAQNFAKMKEEQKKNVVNSILCKFSQFKELQKQFSGAIQYYLQDPLNKYLKLQDTYQKLDQIIRKNICHEDAQNYYKIKHQQEDDLQLNPLQILEGIKLLFRFSQSCKMDIERQEKDKKVYQDYYDYLLYTFFKPIIKLLTNLFATNSREKNIFQTIDYIFSQFIIFLKILCEVDKERISAKKIDLKDLILPSNQLFMSEKEIISKYLMAICDQNLDFESFTTQQLIHFVKLLKENRTSPSIIRTCSQTLFRIHHQIGLNYSKAKQYIQSLKEFNEAIFNVLRKNIFCKQSIKTQTQQCLSAENFQKIERVLNNIYHIYSSINKQNFKIDNLLSPINNHLQKIHQIFMSNNLVNVIKNYHSTKDEATFKIFHLYRLALLYEEISDFKSAIVKFSQILSLNEIRRNLNICRLIKTRIGEIQKKNISALSSETVNFKMQSKNKYVIGFINRINAQVIKTQIRYRQSQLQQLTQQEIKIQQQSKMKEQFQINLPSQINFFNILKYTQYQIEKINNRKVTFLIGGNAGKTTAFYCIKGTPLVGSKNKRTYTLADHCKQKSRINHNGSMPTQIPNFAMYKKDEIIIDLPVLNSKNIRIKVLYPYLFLQMIQKSSAYRFLIIVKQEQMKGKCLQIIQNIRLLIKIFKNSQLIESKIAILITCAQNDSIVQIRKKLKQLMFQLGVQKLKHDQQENKEEVQQIEMIVKVLNQIMTKVKFTFFVYPNVQNSSIIKNEQILRLLQQKEFDYGKVAQLNSLFVPVISNFKELQHNKLKKRIDQIIESIKINSAKIIQFVSNYYKCIIIQRKKKPSLSLEMSQNDKQQCLGILKKQKQQPPFLYNFLFQTNIKRGGTQRYLINQIYSIYRIKEFIETCCQGFDERANLILNVFKNVINIPMEDIQSQFQLSCFLIKTYQKIQQLKILNKILKKQPIKNIQLQDYFYQLSNFSGIWHRLFQIGNIDNKQLLCYFCDKLQINKFQEKQQQQLQIIMFELLKLIQEFSKGLKIKQEFYKILNLVKEIKNINKIYNMSKIIIRINLIEIDLYSKIPQNDILFQNNRYIPLIKIICKHLIPIDLMLAKEIGYTSKIKELNCQIFEHIEEFTSDSAYKKSILAQYIDYLMINKLYKKAVQKCDEYIARYIEQKTNDLQKQKYYSCSIDARKHINQDQNTVQEIKRFKIDVFVKLKEKILKAIQK